MIAILVTCAESAAIEPPTNQLSLVRLAEEMTASSFPAIVSLAFVVVLVKSRSEPDDPPAQLFITLNDAILFEVPLKISFDGKLRTTTIFNLQNLPIPGPGYVVLSVKVDNRVLGSWPITVNAASDAAERAHATRR